MPHRPQSNRNDSVSPSKHVRLADSCRHPADRPELPHTRPGRRVISIFFKLLKSGQLQLAKNLPQLRGTYLVWVVAGDVGYAVPESQFSHTATLDEVSALRKHPVGFTADRQTRVTPSDTPFQRIFWLNKPSDFIRVFEHTTVMHGTASAKSAKMKKRILNWLGALLDSWE